MYRKHFEGNRPVGRDRFEYILDKYNLKVRKKKRKPRTTDSRHGLPTYPNQAKSYIPTQANRLWVSDITYIPIHVNESKHIFCYLSLILDAYSKEIVGWAVGETLEPAIAFMHCVWLSSVWMILLEKNSYITQTEDVSMPVKNTHLC